MEQSADFDVETLPDGGIRIQAQGIDLRVSREAIERSEREGGIGFNWVSTPEEHELQPPRGVDVDSPISNIHNFGVQLYPNRALDDE